MTPGMAGPTTTNGDSHQHTQSSAAVTPETLPLLIQALEAVYNPQSSNETRQQASFFLSDAKNHAAAPWLGFSLANDRSQPPALRHYGLSMLEHSVCYLWNGLGQEDAERIQQYVIHLAETIDDSDPLYIRNKVAQLWTELVKKSWDPKGWPDMDKKLCELWGKTQAHKEMVLYTLEMLSEDVFTKEDATAVLRGPDLGRYCVEIYIPASTLRQHFPDRENFGLRCGDDGWLARFCEALDWCSTEDNEVTRSLGIRTLNAMKACFNWITPKAIIDTDCIARIIKVLDAPFTPLVTVRSCHRG